MQIRIRSFHTTVEHKLIEAGRAGETPLRKVAAVAIIENPYWGSYVEDLKPLIEQVPYFARIRSRNTCTYQHGYLGLFQRWRLADWLRL